MHKRYVVIHYNLIFFPLKKAPEENSFLITMLRLFSNAKNDAVKIINVFDFCHVCG